MLLFFGPPGEAPHADGEAEARSLADFIGYLQEKWGDEDLGIRFPQFIALADSMERAGLLRGAPGSHPPFRNFSVLGLGVTAAQSNGILWLARALGPELIIRSYGAATIAITGISADGEASIGTGLLLDARHLLTNKHVVEEMTLDRELKTSATAAPDTDVEVAEQQSVRVVNFRSHESIDVAVVEIEPISGEATIKTVGGVAFRGPGWEDDTWTFGYPRVPMAIDPPPLVVHKGSVVNPCVRDMLGCKYFLFSATSRPGNSGGPIVAQDGRVLGIVTRTLEIKGDTVDDRLHTPFYAGVPTNQIAKALVDLGYPDLLKVEKWGPVD